VRYLNILLDACVIPETVCPVYKYSEQKRDLHTKLCFILADKKSEIEFCLSIVSFSLKRVVLAVRGQRGLIKFIFKATRVYFIATNLWQVEITVCWKRFSQCLQRTASHFCYRYSENAYFTGSSMSHSVKNKKIAKCYVYGWFIRS
jgi:hypothetical protein